MAAAPVSLSQGGWILAVREDAGHISFWSTLSAEKRRPDRKDLSLRFQERIDPAWG